MGDEKGARARTCWVLLPSVRVSENIDFFSFPPNLSMADTELMRPPVFPVTGTGFTSPL